MHGLMMDFQLTIPALARRAETFHPDRAIVARRADGTIHRTNYRDVLGRARRLIGALQALGVRPDDRVATFCWNHHQHLEAYYGVPCMGAVLHTLNIRLHPDELAYIATHAGDSVAIVDRVLLPAFEKFRANVPFRHVIVVDGGADTPAGMLDYETLIAAHDEVPFDETIGERQAAAMCYTSGTTGRSKGVMYTHRSNALHSLALGLHDLNFVRQSDTVLAVVPMFHANAWGIPYASLLHGCAQVMPGPALDARSILDLIEQERVTVAAGVPTIWMAVLQALDAEPKRWDLSRLRHMICGGASVPESLMRAYQERHGVYIQQAWGMTETSPLGSMATPTHDLLDADEKEHWNFRTTGGRAVPFVETRIRGETGFVAWDGQSMGELEVRGPWVAGAYYESPESTDRFTDDGWFKTGDIVSIDARGFITLRDRAKDVIKSGGEWISSVALENMLMKHPMVAEAAVVGLKHPQWDERPLALVVLREGGSCTPDELTSHLMLHFPKWWMPNAYEFAIAIPRTSVGKFNKRAIREMYDGYFERSPVVGTVGPEAANERVVNQ